MYRWDPDRWWSVQGWSTTHRIREGRVPYATTCGRLIAGRTLLPEASSGVWRCGQCTTRREDGT